LAKHYTTGDKRQVSYQVTNLVPQIFYTEFGYEVYQIQYYWPQWTHANTIVQYWAASKQLR